MAEERDVIDEWMAKWTSDLPLDREVEGIVDRIALLNKRIKRMLEETLVEFGLNVGEWHVLSALWNSGEPYRSSPGALSKRAELTTGAMTNRIDRLEAAGLVRREAEPTDRRGVRVVLTEQGLALVDRAIEVRFDEASSAVAKLSADDRRVLERILRRLVVELHRGSADEDAST
jgi:DNA-binding MarR family transcriptional regulator